MSLLAILSFALPPIISTVYATVWYYNESSKSWSTGIIFYLPIIISVVALPFILIGLLIGNLQLLGLIYSGLLIGVPLTILFIIRIGYLIDRFIYRHKQFIYRMKWFIYRRF